MIRALLLAAALASPGAAETASVLSGEHADFTRIVIQLDGAPDWTVGRTAEGYAFATRADSQPDYNLSRVWDLIPRSRLSDVTVDPDTGALDFALGCACHIFPFELGPGRIVLDIKAGPPPTASAFEAEFSLAGPSPETASSPAVRPETPADAAVSPTPDPVADRAGKPNGKRPKGYDWLARAQADGASPTAAPFPLPLDTGTVSLDPLRDELLEEIARGAAEGIVDMELPGKAGKTPSADPEDLPWANIRIGEQPGIVVTDPDAFAEGARPLSDCAAPELLDLPAWGEGQSPHQLLAAARDGLFGEFDTPDTEAVLRSMRQLLYLGFGAEARQHAGFLEPQAAGEMLPFYLSMGRLVDGQTDPQTPFAQMLDCDGPAALWAALAHDRLPAGPGVNRDAILQAFQALPPYLRQHLGAGLAEKFLARQDAESARIIRDAMQRTPEADMAVVALLDARTELYEGNPDAAQTHAEAAVALDGDRPENLVALVETHFRKLDPIDPAVAEALQAMQGETAGTGIAEAVDRAVVLALALSGQYEAAFGQGNAQGRVLADLWQIAQSRAGDDDFLRHAVLPGDVAPPNVRPEVGLAVAERLLALGFADAARVWIGPVETSDPPEPRLAAATAEYGRGDARAAVALLDGLDGPAAEALRAKALVRLGDLATATQALAATGDAEGAARLGLWRGDWAKPDAVVPEPWKLAADQALPVVTSPETGPLTRGGLTLDASLASREALTALLAAVPSPSGN